MHVLPGAAIGAQNRGNLRIIIAKPEIEFLVAEVQAVHLLDTTGDLLQLLEPFAELLILFGEVGTRRGPRRNSHVCPERGTRRQSAFYMPVSDWLSARTEPGDRVALSDVGYVKYYSGVYVIDTLGLTDKHLAKMPGGPAWATDVDYVLDKRPLFIVSMIRHYGDIELGHTEFDRKIAENARFRKEYRLADELEGYKASERALGDRKVRRYSVTFRIYGRRNP